MMSSFFDSHEGNARNYMRWPWLARALDAALDARLRIGSRGAHLAKLTRDLPRQEVLVVGVSVPSRPADLAEVTSSLSRTRHHVDVSTVPMLPKGKFENVDQAIAAAPRPLACYDWLVVTDDDVGLPADFLDKYLALATAANLSISQPAHRYHSYATYRSNRRALGAFVRQCNFVEIGPLTVFRSDTFARIVPFPSSRWAYGIDVLWAHMARENGWRMGIVDALAVEHKRPVAKTYDMEAARAEGRELLARCGVTLERSDVFSPSKRLI